jgi:hypothetical protein
MSNNGNYHRYRRENDGPPILLIIYLTLGLNCVLAVYLLTQESLGKVRSNKFKGRLTIQLEVEA